MTVLPNYRVQCDTCLAVHVLAAKSSDDWGAELYDLGWRARLKGSNYRHFCRPCAEELEPERATTWVRQ